MSELKSIDELMDGKNPGEIKILSDFLGKHHFFPYFKAKKNFWYGLGKKGGLRCFKGDERIWTLFEEPKLQSKNKLILWQWYKNGRLSEHITENYYYAHLCDSQETWQKIESTKIEIEVEE